MTRPTTRKDRSLPAARAVLAVGAVAFAASMPFGHPGIGVAIAVVLYAAARVVGGVRAAASVGWVLCLGMFTGRVAAVTGVVSPPVIGAVTVVFAVVLLVAARRSQRQMVATDSDQRAGSGDDET